MKGNGWRTLQEKKKIKDLERVKRELRGKYTEKHREVKRSIKADKRKFIENIASKAEDKIPR